jgi:hypothetical protein
MLAKIRENHDYTEIFAAAAITGAAEAMIRLAGSTTRGTRGRNGTQRAPTGSRLMLGVGARCRSGVQAARGSVAAATVAGNEAMDAPVLLLHRHEERLDLVRIPHGPAHARLFGRLDVARRVVRVTSRRRRQRGPGGSSREPRDTLATPRPWTFARYLGTSRLSRPVGSDRRAGGPAFDGAV